MADISEMGQALRRLATQGPEAAHDIIALMKKSPEAIEALTGAEKQIYTDALRSVHGKVTVKTDPDKIGTVLAPDHIAPKEKPNYGKVIMAAGVAPVGMLEPHIDTPIDYIKKGVGAYEEGKGKVMDAIANQMAPGKNNELARKFIFGTGSVALDPVNLIEGPVGIAAQGAQMLGGNNEEAKPEYADGGGVEAPLNFSGLPIVNPEAAGEAHYGTTGQQIGAAVEGVGKGLAGPAFTQLETIGHRVGVPGLAPKDIRGRAQANPVTQGVGEAAGLVGGDLIGVGEGALLSKAGEAAKLGVRGTGIAAKIGSSAVKTATEAALYQAGDETSKHIINDPTSSAETALAHIGLAAALGGAGGAFVTGAVSPLWRATVGDAADKGLGAIASKLGGVDGNASEMQDLADKAGVNLSDVGAAVLSGDDSVAARAGSLRQSNSIAGRSANAALNADNDVISNKLAEAVGHDSSYVEDLPKLDKYNLGSEIHDSLKSDLKQQIDPINSAYDKTTNEFKNTEVSNAVKTQIKDSLGQTALKDGWTSGLVKEKGKLLEDVYEALADNRKVTVNDLKNLITDVRDAHGFQTPTYGAGKDVRKALNAGLEQAITDGITSSGGSAAEVAARLGDYKQLQSNYSDLMGKLEDLNGHLHVGKYGGPKGFLEKMADLNPEAFVQRLSGASKADALTVLNDVSPSTLAKIRQFHVDELLRAAAKDGKLIPDKFSKAYDKLTPQIQDLIAGPEQKEQIEALKGIAQKLKTVGPGFSDKVASKVVGHASSAAALGALLMGHGPLAVTAYLGKLGFTEGEAALKLAMLKFLGSNQPIKSEAFKAMVSMIDKSMKGEAALVKGAESVFNPAVEVGASHSLPSSKELEKLDKAVGKVAANPESVMPLTNGALGHYMPDHQAGISQAITAQVSYLAQLKPKAKQLSPYDKPLEPTFAQQARYMRALGIAAKPMSLYSILKKGTLQSTDVQDISRLYPKTYQKMQQNLMNSMIKAHSEKKSLPYKTRMSLSLFLGQPIDSTMTPQSIQSAQAPTQAQQQMAQTGAKQAPGLSQKGGKALADNAKSYQTALQRSEADHNKS